VNVTSVRQRPDSGNVATKSIHPEASGWRTPPSLASSGPAELTEPAGKRTSTETASSATTAGVAQAGESAVIALEEGLAQEASSRGRRRAWRMINR